MHNFDDVVYFYNQGNEYLLDFNQNLATEDRQNNSDREIYNNYFQHTDMNIGIIVDVLITMKRYDEVFKIIETWEQISDSLDFKINKSFSRTAKSLCFLCLGDTLKYNITIKQLDPKRFFVDNCINSMKDFFVYKWYLAISEMNLDNKNPFSYRVGSTAGGELEMHYFESKIVANSNKLQAIELLEDALVEFNEKNKPIYECYMNNPERIYMFLSYLYYKVNNPYKAKEIFRLALTKDKCSTFMGDWNYWLNYRDYYKDEYKVMLRLKELYLEKE